MKSLKGILVVSVLLSLAVVAGLANAAEQGPAVIVTNTWGHAEVKLKAAADFTRLAEGTRLGVGDMVQTGDRGKIQLELSDRSKIVVGPASRVVIKELDVVEVTRVSTSTFELVRGKIRAIVHPFATKDSRFTVETGNATVGVRGTDFGVTRDPDADVTGVLTIEGTIYLMLTHFPHLPPILVNGGEGLTVKGGILPSKPSKPGGNTTFEFLQEMMTFPHEGVRGYEGGSDGDHEGGRSGPTKSL